MAAALPEVMLTRTAEAWEAFPAGIHVPATRARNEALDFEQVRKRKLLHRFETARDVDRPLTVPVASFRSADDGPRVDTPPRTLGADTDAVRASGLTAVEIASVRQGMASDATVPGVAGESTNWVAMAANRAIGAMRHGHPAVAAARRARLGQWRPRGPVRVDKLGRRSPPRPHRPETGQASAWRPGPGERPVRW